MTDPAKIREFVQLVIDEAQERSLGHNFGFALGRAEHPDPIALHYGEAIGVSPQEGLESNESYRIGYRTAVRDIAMSYLLGLEEKRITDVPWLSTVVTQENIVAPLKLICDNIVYVADQLDPKAVSRLQELRLISPLPTGVLVAATLLGQQVVDRLRDPV